MVVVVQNFHELKYFWHLIGIILHFESTYPTLMMCYESYAKLLADPSASHPEHMTN